MEEDQGSCSTGGFDIAGLAAKLAKSARTTPEGFFKNHEGLFVQVVPDVVKLDGMKSVEEHVKDNSDTMLIGYIGGVIPTPSSLRKLRNDIMDKVGVSSMFDRNWSRGFFSIKVDSKEDGDKVISAGPHFIQGYPCLFQFWNSSFDPECPTVIRMPIEIRMRDLPHFLWTVDVLAQALKQVGVVMKIDHELDRGRVTRAIVGIFLEKFIPEISVPDYGGRIWRIKLEYKDFEFRCWFCRSAAHSFKRCPEKLEGFSYSDFQNSRLWACSSYNGASIPALLSDFKHDINRLAEASLSEEGISIDVDDERAFQVYGAFFVAARNMRTRSAFQELQWEANLLTRPRAPKSKRFSIKVTIVEDGSGTQPTGRANQGELSSSNTMDIG